MNAAKKAKLEVTPSTPAPNLRPKVFPKKEISRQPVNRPKPIRLGRPSGTEALPVVRFGKDHQLECEAAPTPQNPSATLTAPIRFEIIAPRAKAVFIAGSFNDWNHAAAALARSGEGKWAVELALAPGRHEYMFVVDGLWMCDPASKDYVPNPFGGCNSVVTVPVRGPR